jgi:hypothetical protein
MAPHLSSFPVFISGTERVQWFLIHSRSAVWIAEFLTRKPRTNLLPPFKAFDIDDATISLKPPAAITEAQQISTSSRPIAPNDARENPHSIPRLQQFLEVNDDNDFRGLVGDENGQEIETLAEWPTSFLLHPKAFACLGGAKEIRAHEAGLIFIKATIEPTTQPKTLHEKYHTAPMTEATKKKATKPQETALTCRIRPLGATAFSSSSGRFPTEWAPKSKSRTRPNLESRTHK